MVLRNKVRPGLFGWLQLVAYKALRFEDVRSLKKFGGQILFSHGFRTISVPLHSRVDRKLAYRRQTYTSFIAPAYCSSGHGMIIFWNISDAKCAHFWDRNNAEARRSCLVGASH